MEPEQFRSYQKLGSDDHEHQSPLMIEFMKIGGEFNQASKNPGSKAPAERAEHGNSDFINNVKKETQISPSTEWSIFGAALATKGTAKAFVLSHLGADAGIMGKVGIPAGISLGVAGAGFLTYELSNYWENSSRANEFEKKLMSSSQALGGTDQNHLSKTALIDGHSSGGIPGFRDVFDAAGSTVHKSFDHLLAKDTGTDHKQELIDKSMAHNSLTNEQFIKWAKEETSTTTGKQLAQDGVFGSVGLAGAIYAGGKLGLGKLAGPTLAWLGAAGAIGLSRLKTAAEEDTKLSTLYESRLLSQEKFSR